MSWVSFFHISSVNFLNYTKILVLKLHEDLIVSKSATEYAEAKYLSFQDEANLLRDQLLMRDRERQAMERELTNRIQTLE